MSTETFYFIIQFQLYLSDIFYLSPPWFLLLLSKSMREELITFFGFKTNQVQQIFNLTGNLSTMLNR